MEALKERFRPEFLGRLDDVIFFAPLGKETMMKIAERMLEEIQRRAREIGITLLFSPEVARLLTEEPCHADNGARPLRRAIIQRIEDPLSTKLLEEAFGKGDRVLVSVEGGEVKFTKETAEVKS